jgi:hypothetical protein
MCLRNGYKLNSKLTKVYGWAIQSFNPEIPDRVSGAFHFTSFTPIKKKMEAQFLERYPNTAGFYGYLNKQDAYNSWMGLKGMNYETLRITYCKFENIIEYGEPNIGINGIDERRIEAFRAKYRTVLKVFAKDYKPRNLRRKEG